MAVAACSDYMPKPRGYVRIEPASHQYILLSSPGAPYEFQVSSLARVEYPQIDTLGWVNINYPSFHAKIYCSYLPIKPDTYAKAEEESYILMNRQAKNDRISQKEYVNEEKNVFASLFILEGESPAPVQFSLTDRRSHFFRGTLLYDVDMNADSLAPVTEHIKDDVIELIQSFSWTK